MRIDNPIITGSFSVNGDSLLDLNTLTTTGSNTFVGNQSIVGAVSASSLTGSLDYSNIINTPTLISGSSQVISILSSLNSYTQSNDTTNQNQNNRLNSIEGVTGSYETNGRGLVSGSSQVTLLLPTGTVSGSSQVIGILDSLNSYTSSVKNAINVIGEGTASVTTVYGNLVVEGTTLTVSASNLAVADNMIYLNDGNEITDPDLGIAGNYNDGTYSHAGIFSDASDGHTWKVYKGYTPEPSQSIDITHGSFTLADFQAATLKGSISATNGVVSGSSQVIGILSSLNTYTGSNDTKWSTLLNVTASLIARTGSLATTGSNTFFANQIISGNVLISGSIGMGTTTPGYRLEILGDGSGTGELAIKGSGTDIGIALNNTGTSGKSWRILSTGGGSGAGNGKLVTWDGTGYGWVIDNNRYVGIGTTVAYSPLTLKGYGVSWGENVTIYPSPTGYTTIALRLEGTDTTTGTWAIGKNSSQYDGNIEYLQIVKNGLTGSPLNRADAVQIWNPSNGNSSFGFKVGIGTTNPSDTLHVIGSSRWGTAGNNLVSYADGGGVYMELTGANSNQRQLRIQGINNSANRYSSIRLEAGIEEIAFNTADLERMRIRSNGAVTRAYQPAFLAYSENSGFTVTANGWYNISNALTQESYDIGSNYNASNGRFTAPVAGRYFFYAGGWSQIGSASNGERYAFCARVNDGALTFIGGGNYCIGDTPLSGYTLVCNLAASDFVDLWVFSAVTGTWGSGSHRTYWGGYLL